MLLLLLAQRPVRCGPLVPLVGLSVAGRHVCSSINPFSTTAGNTPSGTPSTPAVRHGAVRLLQEADYGLILDEPFSQQRHSQVWRGMLQPKSRKPNHTGPTGGIAVAVKSTPPGHGDTHGVLDGARSTGHDQIWHEATMWSKATVGGHPHILPFI